MKRTILCSTLLIWAFLYLTAAEGSGADLKTRFEQATVVTRFDTEESEVRHVAVVGDYLVMKLRRPDSTLAVIRDFAGVEHFRYGLAYRLDRGLGLSDLSEDGHTVVIGEMVSEDYTEYKVFDLNGALRFEYGSSCFVITSPSGKHFATLAGELTNDALSVLDSTGAPMLKMFEPRHDWSCRFLNEDLLVVVTLDTATVIDCRSGERRWTLPLGLTGSPSRPGISISRRDSVIAVYVYNSVVLFTWDGKETWRNQYTDRLANVLFDENAPFVALQFSSREQQAGYFIVAPVQSPQNGFATAMLDELYGYHQRTYGANWMRDGLIAVWGPPKVTLRTPNDRTDYWTVFVQLDSLHQSQLASIKQHGVFWKVESEDDSMRFLRMRSNGDIDLISMH